jgi:hypothetical protein
VGGKAVELDDQLGLTPHGIDVLCLDDGVDFGAWETVAIDEADEAVLQFDSGRGRTAKLEEKRSEVLLPFRRR